MPATEPAGLRFGRFELRPAQRELLADGAAVTLGARAIDVLCALVERRGRIVAKDELLEIAWPGLVVEENNLPVQISALRRVLGYQTITTIPGRGYQFTAPLVTSADGVAKGAEGIGHATRVEPAPPSVLVGREVELRALSDLLRAHRIVTIVGAGGMGKTALAQATLASLGALAAPRERPRDGALLVELAAVHDPALLPQAVAQALRIKLNGSGSAPEQLLRAIAAQELLLVLDNCEHLLVDVGALVRGIEGVAPGVRVLSTSQERLNIPGEQVFRLGPLRTSRSGSRAPARRCADGSAFRAKPWPRRCRCEHMSARKPPRRRPLRSGPAWFFSAISGARRSPSCWSAAGVPRTRTVPSGNGAACIWSSTRWLGH